MPNRHILRKAVVVLVLLSSAAARAIADERAACEILPNTAAVYLEIRQPQNLLNTVYDHKLVRRIEELDQVRSAMEGKEY